MSDPQSMMFKITSDGSTSDGSTFGFKIGYPHDVIIDWGDSVLDTITGNSSYTATHPYAHGEYLNNILMVSILLRLPASLVVLQ